MMLMAKSVPYQIPFDAAGNMIRRCWSTTGVSLIDNFKFSDMLQYTGMAKTQSSNYAMFRSTKTNKKYYMFMKDFDNLLKKHTLKIGYIYGTFTFRKHGQSYGIKIISSADPLQAML